MLSRVALLRAPLLLSIMLSLCISACGDERQEPSPGTPADKFDEALRIGPLSDRASALAKVLSEAREADWDAILAILAREVSSLDEPDLSQVIDARTASSPEAALEAVEAWPYPLKREIGLHAVVRSSAVRDAAAGTEIFETVTGKYPRLRGDLQASLIEGWAYSDRESLLVYLASLSPEEIGPPLGAALGQIARFHGLATLEAWTEALIAEIPEGPLPAKIFRKSVRTMARRDPAAAVDWWARNQNEPFALDSPDAIAEAWILIAPYAAIEWLQTTAPAERRDRSLEVAFGRWLYEDRNAAREWLDSGLRTEFMDPAVAVLARQMVRRNPTGAAEECDRIINGETQIQCWVSVARGWLRRDREGGLAWLESSPLDEETRAEVLVAAPNPNPTAESKRRVRAQRRGR